MFYCYTIVIPAVVALVWYARKRPATVGEWTGYFWGLELILGGYSMVAYFMEMYTSWSTGWAAPTLWVFLIPAFPVTSLLKALFWWRKRKQKTMQVPL